jgi:predicted Zn-dependent peptidase
VKEDKLKKGELNQTKEKIRGPLLFSMENPINQMEFFARQALNVPDNILTHEQVIDRLMQIDSESIRKVARELFTTDKLNLAVVGPVEEKRVRDLVQKLVV